MDESEYVNALEEAVRANPHYGIDPFTQGYQFGVEFALALFQSRAVRKSVVPEAVQFHPHPYSAVRWFRIGDHPEDFRGPVLRVQKMEDTSLVGQKCPTCRKFLLDHGVLAQPPNCLIVCPGSWVVNIFGKEIVMTNEQFHYACTMVEMGVEDGQKSFQDSSEERSSSCLKN